MRTVVEFYLKRTEEIDKLGTLKNHYTMHYFKQHNTNVHGTVFMLTLTTE